MSVTCLGHGLSTSPHPHGRQSRDPAVNREGRAGERPSGAGAQGRVVEHTIGTDGQRQTRRGPARFARGQEGVHAPPHGQDSGRGGRELMREGGELPRTATPVGPKPRRPTATSVQASPSLCTSLSFCPPFPVCYHINYVSTKRGSTPPPLALRPGWGAARLLSQAGAGPATPVCWDRCSRGT